MTFSYLLVFISCIIRSGGTFGYPPLFGELNIFLSPRKPKDFVIIHNSLTQQRVESCALLNSDTNLGELKVHGMLRHYNIAAVMTDFPPSENLQFLSEVTITANQSFIRFHGISSTANAQNSSSINSNGLPTNGTAKTATANQTNKTVAAPGTTTTIVTAGNKTIVLNTPSTTRSSSPVNLNRTGFTNLYVLTSPTGKSFPLKYSIKGSKVAGMLLDKDRTTLVMVLDPSQKGGNMTIELPRNIIDSKGASNSDTKYQIKIDGKGVDYKELANNMNARILSIAFSKDNRFIEIIGTQMTS